MSRIPSDHLRTCIDTILKFSEEHKRNFPETIELQIGLKHYDIKKDKRFAGSFELPACPRPNLNCCVLGDASHCEQAAALGLPYMTVEDLGKLKGQNKLVKRLCKRYAFFVASESVFKSLPRIVGPGFNKAGKFPSLVKKDEDLMNKINGLRSTIKFQLKKSLSLNIACANVNMDKEDIAKNIILSVNFLISLLKKGWTNINTLHIKSTMGPAQRLF
ncbi:hypothetical protein P9112_006739 [Eukaryota sp. TZLM1-RC]